MRSPLTWVVALAATAGVSAQTNNTLWNYASDSANTATTFTSRHTIGATEDGWVYKDFFGYCAIGNDFDDSTLQATNGELAGFVVVIQDQVGVTPQTYEAAILSEDPTNPGNPPCPPTAGTTIATSGPVTTPASTATGAVAWIVTFTFATPPNTLPVADPVYLGVRLTPEVATGDYLGWHGAWYTQGTVGENPHAAAPNATVVCNITQGNLLVNPGGGTDNRNPRGGILTRRPVFEIGADIDPAFDRNGSAGADYGIAGRFPDTNVRGDGICFRIKDANSEGLPAGVIGAIGPLPPNPINGGQVGLFGWLCLDLAGILPVTFAQGVITAGVVEQCPFPFGNNLPLPQGAIVHFQGVVLDFAQARAHLTNGVELRQL